MRSASSSYWSRDRSIDRLIDEWWTAQSADADRFIDHVDETRDAMNLDRITALQRLQNPAQRTTLLGILFTNLLENPRLKSESRTASFPGKDVTRELLARLKALAHELQDSNLTNPQDELVKMVGAKVLAHRRLRDAIEGVLVM
jgi:hypothetical protein